MASTFELPDLDFVETVSYDKVTCIRGKFDVPMQYAHKKINEICRDQPLEAGDDPFAAALPDFAEHPVRLQALADGIHWSKIRPVAVYFDGVRYTKNENFEGFFFHDLRSNTRHLSYIVLRSDFCKCGCRGWCTLYPLLLRWSEDMNAGGDGVFLDPARQEERLEIRLVVHGSRADWPALCQMAAVRTWGHNLSPCFACDLNKVQMRSTPLHECSLDIAPWNPYTRQDYDADLLRHKISIPVPNIATRQAIYRSLMYSFKFFGRVVKFPIRVGGVDLLVGDRLEPTASMLDVGDFETKVPPFNALFWRGSTDDRVSHESPLYLIKGFFLNNHGVDILHAWHLGPLLYYLPLVFNLFIKSLVMLSSNLPHISLADTRRLALLRIKSKLWTFYKLKRLDPDWKRKGSEVWNLTEAMMGKKKGGKVGEFKCKAAEAKGLLEFCVYLLSEYSGAFAAKGGLHGTHAAYLLASGEAAVQFELILHSHGRAMPHAAQNELFAAYIKHASLYQRAGGVMMPKHHLMIHLLMRVARHGNPVYYHTYKDESLNGVIARIARSCHRTSFGMSVHMKFSLLTFLIGTAAVELHP